MIPIYRAKKIDSDEYVVGYYTQEISDINRLVDCIVSIYDTDSEINPLIALFVEIDPSTLAIHFGGMLDKNGVKIFAGLRVNNAPDRKCGDLVKLGQHKGRVVQALGEIFVNSGDSYAFYQNHKDGFISKFEWSDLEVVGATNVK